jgi:hypothetical protein
MLNHGSGPARAAGTRAAALALATFGVLGLAAGAGAQTTPPSAHVPPTSYGYGPGPLAPACAQGQVRLALSLPVAGYFGGSPVPFKVRMTNVSSHPCSVTALPAPSGLATELVYVRIFDSHRRRVLIPGGPPGLRVRMLPRSLAAHQVFSYICSWSGRVWTRRAGPQAVGLGGVPAPAGGYTGIAVLAHPALQTGPLHFILKAR